MTLPLPTTLTALKSAHAGSAAQCHSSGSDGDASQSRPASMPRHVAGDGALYEPDADTQPATHTTYDYPTSASRPSAKSCDSTALAPTRLLTMADVPLGMMIPVSAPKTMESLRCALTRLNGSSSWRVSPCAGAWVATATAPARADGTPRQFVAISADMTSAVDNLRDQVLDFERRHQSSAATCAADPRREIGNRNSAVVTPRDALSVQWWSLGREGVRPIYAAAIFALLVVLAWTVRLLGQAHEGGVL